MRHPSSLIRRVGRVDDASICDTARCPASMAKRSTRSSVPQPDTSTTNPAGDEAGSMFDSPSNMPAIEPLRNSPSPKRSACVPVRASSRPMTSSSHTAAGMSRSTPSKSREHRGRWQHPHRRGQRRPLEALQRPAQTQRGERTGELQSAGRVPQRVDPSRARRAAGRAPARPAPRRSPGTRPSRPWRRTGSRRHRRGSTAAP